MKVPSSFLIILNFIFFIMLGSCSSTKLASEDSKTLKTQGPPEDKALVYIVRPSSMGFALTFKVTCDSTHIGSTSAKRFIYAFLDPGVHQFICKAENKGKVSLQAEAGKTYFIEQQIQMGIVSARVKLQVLDEQKGRKKLQSCKLSGDCPAYSLAKQ